jgi:ubiquitin-like protein Pup
MSDSGGQVRKQRTKQDDEQAVEATETAEAVDTSDVDELLDEIDDVLEENAEEFVKNYVQKGGE